MIRRQGYRFRLKATQTDAAFLRRSLGCSRFVWNAVLAMNELRHEHGERRLGYTAMCEYLVFLKDDNPFLREVHSQPVQQTLKDLATAYQRAFDPKLMARFPRFKKKDKRHGSLWRFVLRRIREAGNPSCRMSDAFGESSEAGEYVKPRRSATATAGFGCSIDSMAAGRPPEADRKTQTHQRPAQYSPMSRSERPT